MSVSNKAHSNGRLPECDIELIILGDIQPRSARAIDCLRVRLFLREPDCIYATQAMEHIAVVTGMVMIAVMDCNT